MHIFFQNIGRGAVLASWTPPASHTLQIGAFIEKKNVKVQENANTQLAT